MARAITDSQMRWMEARYHFFNSPEGKFVLWMFFFAFVIIYGASFILSRGLYDKQLTHLAQQVCDPGWRITHSGFPAVGILVGTHQGLKFRYAIFGGGFLSKAHLFLEAPTQVSLKISIRNRESIEEHAKLFLQFPGFRALFSSPRRVPFYVFNIETRPVGFGSKPGVDLLVAYGKYFDPTLLKNYLAFLQNVSTGAQPL